MFGFLNINKPQNMTSHDVVAVLRKITGIKQIGHTGTLDPFATGVLPICIGKATRLIEYLGNDKCYIADIKFGFITDTYDCEGKIIQSFEKKIEREELSNIINDFIGEIEQIPPIYSAIKINGKKLYEYARKGEAVEIKPRKVVIQRIKLIDFNYENQTATLEIDCKSGTYIRSLAYDIAKKLNTGAYITDLIRTKSDKFLINNSLDLENLNIDKILPKIINPINILDMEKVKINEEEVKIIKNGMPINKNINNGFVSLLYNNELCAVGLAYNKVIKMKKVFL